MTIVTEDFWDDLLDLIDAGHVLPIIGQGVTTIGPNNALLAPWMARKLAERLDLRFDDRLTEPALHDVICRHLITGKDRGQIDMRLFRILRDESHPPGATLNRLSDSLPRAEMPRGAVFLS